MSGSKVVGFRMVIHVDNNPCEAVIHPVKIGSRVANPCGFLNFDNTGDLVTIAFKARHENDFATFNFEINRGSVGLVEGASGKVGTAVSGYSEANGEYSKDVLVSYLLRALNPGDEPCVRAAFAETLYVRAMATNGSPAPREWSAKDTCEFVSRTSPPKLPSPFPYSRETSPD